MCGDIHGALSGLVYDLVERYKIEHADILVLGDFGAGFGGPNAMNVRYDEVKKRLEGNDLCIYSIRGNHDDPSFFDGKHDYERLKFSPSHQIIELCGKKIYPIGGAVSNDIDRKDPRTGRTRREENERLKRFGRRSRRPCAEAPWLLLPYRLWRYNYRHRHKYRPAYSSDAK